MSLFSRIVVLVAVAVLAGCETLPVPGSEQVVCPEVEVPECPQWQIEEQPEPRVLEKIVLRPAPPQRPPPPPPPTTAGELDLPIIGAVEFVTIDPPGVRLEAVIDTAAEGTTVAARNVRLLEKDGKRHVSFVLVDPVSGEEHEIEAQVRRRVSNQHADGSTTRNYVVQMWLVLGDNRTRVEVGLSERTDMPYPLVVGRNLLTDVAIVDVSRRHTLDNQ
ncbi:MAG: RimK/LysX family protein [Haliea sp.]|uniref:putative ATP-dependent zinc protease n=1 Tax=Haliea sp. TaxID=1932666 RepID=UPI0032EFF85C